MTNAEPKAGAAAVYSRKGLLHEAADLQAARTEVLTGSPSKQNLCCSGGRDQICRVRQTVK